MAGLSLLLVVGVAVVTWVVATRSSDRDRLDDGQSFVVPSVSGAPDSSIRSDEAAQVVQRLERALRRSDQEGAAALAAPQDSATAALLGAMAANVAAIGIDDLSVRYVEETGALASDGTWPAAISVVWRYTGFDVASARTEVELRFGLDPDSGTVTIAGVGGPDLRTPVWMSGPAQVRRTPITLLVVSGDGPVQPYQRLATQAVPVVRRVLPEWKPRLVVEVPTDEAALERALGADDGYYAQIAAVTGSSDGSTAPGSPVHVYVNRSVFDGLGAQGQSVVLDHEATHVASDGPRSRAPTWLVEGFADYVALRDTSLPLTKTAAQVAADVRRNGPPSGLPISADFDTGGPHLGAIYESAWLICVTLAERRGEAALTRLYDAVSAGNSLDAELARLFDWSEADLTRAWQDRLRGLAR